MSEAVGSTDPYQVTRGQWVPERNSVVPAWAPKINDFSVTVVVQEGDARIPVAPGFTVGEVAPEHRWAISDPDTGVVMDQAHFNEKFQSWYALHYTMQGMKVEGKPESIPSVLDFVSRKVHPDDITKLVPMTFDPNRPVISKVKPVHDRDGERLSPERLAELEGRKKADEAGAKMAQLVELHEVGDINDETFMKRSKELYGGSVVVGAENADSAAPVAVESPHGCEPVTPAPPEAEAAPTTTALCGATVKVRGKAIHEVNCKKCALVRDKPETQEE